MGRVQVYQCLTGTQYHRPYMARSSLRVVECSMAVRYCDSHNHNTVKHKDSSIQCIIRLHTCASNHRGKHA